MQRTTAVDRTPPMFATRWIVGVGDSAPCTAPSPSLGNADAPNNNHDDAQTSDCSRYLPDCAHHRGRIIRFGCDRLLRRIGRGLDPDEHGEWRDDRSRHRQGRASLPRCSAVRCRRKRSSSRFPAPAIGCRRPNAERPLPRARPFARPCWATSRPSSTSARKPLPATGCIALTHGDVVLISAGPSRTSDGTPGPASSSSE